MSKLALLFIIFFITGIYKTFILGPVWGFYLYEVVYFLNPNIRWWFSSLPNLSYSFIIVISIFLAYAIHRKNVSLNTISQAPPAKWFFLLLLSYCFIYLFSVSPEWHMKFLIELIKLNIIMYFAFRLLDDEKKILFALYAFVLGSVYIGYEAYATGRNGSGRVEGIGLVDMPDSNGVSASIAPAIPMMMYLFWVSNWKYKVLLIVAGILVLNGLVLINSRGAFLGVVIGALYFISYMAFSKFKLPKQKIMLLTILLAGVIGASILVDKTFLERMKTIESSASMEETSVSGGRRMNFWWATFDMLDDHPLGLGIYGFEILSSEYLSPEVMGYDALKKGVRAVHSIWFQILGEIGYLGFIFFMGLLLSVYRFNRKAKKHAKNYGHLKLLYLLISLEASILTFLVSGSFINAGRAQVLYWLLIFSITTSMMILRKNKDLDLKFEPI